MKSARPPHPFQATINLLTDAYLKRTPDATKAIAYLKQNDAVVRVDHIALRSFVGPNHTSGLQLLQNAFVANGYRPEDQIQIPNLPVNARWYEPPETEQWPKVFISELRTHELPTETANIIHSHISDYYDKIGPSALNHALASLQEGDGQPLFWLFDEPPWNPRAEEILEIRRATAGSSAGEYAIWTLTHAHRINHIAILLNVFGPSFEVGGIDELHRIFKARGFQFNPAGGIDGLTQGSPSARLEQSSTVANLVEHTFSCGTTQQVPCSFLEFIRRYDGFRGFLGQNARGIFSSTDSTHHRTT